MAIIINNKQLERLNLENVRNTICKKYKTWECQREEISRYMEHVIVMQYKIVSVILCNIMQYERM